MNFRSIGDRAPTLIRLSRSSVGDEEKEAIGRVIDDAFLGMGTEVDRFETEIQRFIGTKHDVICVSSGTAAIHLAVQCSDIGLGDEILVPSLTYVATFQAISGAGAIPIPCDVKRTTGFIDLEDAEKRVTKKTRAIMPVHYASDSQGMAEIYDFAQQYRIQVIEDAAHSFGSVRNGKKIGQDGSLICFSFDGIKNITSGEGGAIVSANAAVSEKIRNARLLGVEGDTEKRFTGKRSWDFDVNDQGWRYHMSNLMAAVGRAQLLKINYFADRRQRCVELYLEKLRGNEDIELLDLDYKHNMTHIFPIRIKNRRQTDLKDYLEKNGVQTGIHYKPAHLLTKYRTTSKLRNAELLGREVLSLPLHTELTDDEIGYVVGLIERFFSRTVSA